MDLGVGTSSGGLQEDDVALAKLLQEQERALYILGRGGREETAHEDLTDEELARRLQEEEDQATYQAMAGYGSYGLDEVLHEGEGTGTGSEPEQSAMELTYEDMLALGDLAGKVSKGLPPEVLARLQVEAVGNLRSSAGAIILDRCCICQVEFEDSDPATTLPCRHCYHSECVRQWLQQSKACPVCGKEVE
ncbi:hypothetical protein CHLRE_10g442750v5 [Chlamydomonas reinhardtii]|uniref:Uncharacterized protein n=1 Tax=Chlamydomonas reinhardtii TaxID=3055 RepID=A8II68_CHLRE|nr:uncharacterized protein CHLRE_10g442750v5 [Chlamydomonas reinhardtii]PNW77578.1 hypothetical protein CHLRE_10g442750v5 [Chlamydomonas reinhardtii]|eukprot:XP_001690515.1 predicted protein [Chlamydomonas reinhardtii]